MLINCIKLSCAKKTTLLANLVVEVLKCYLIFWHLRNNGEKIIQQTLSSLRSHIINACGFSVMCNVTLKCYVTAERSPSNYSVHSVDFKIYIIIKWLRALWLVNQLWFIVPLNSWKFHVSSELLYKSNRPQVFMVWRHVGRTLKEFVNHEPVASDLRILFVFFQHPAWFISL